MCTEGKCIDKPVVLTMTQRLIDGYAVGRSAAAVTREEWLARFEVEEGARPLRQGWACHGRSQKVKSQAGRPCLQSRWTDAIKRAIRAREEIPLGRGPAVPLWWQRGSLRAPTV